MRIQVYPNKILREPTNPIDPAALDDEEVQLLIGGMIDTMYSSGGVGLAANQVGESKCIFVYDYDGNPEAMINPEVLNRDGESEDTEACLSVPFFSGLIKRSNLVIVRGINIKGQDVIIDAVGALSRVFQHEIDHLSGITILDHVSKLRQDIYRRKLSKVLKRRL